MSGDTVQFSQANVQGQDAKNERSTIGFSYLDLDVGVEVAKAVYARSGLGTCDVDELAAQMGQTISSGAFRLKTISAKMFDLVERDNKNGIWLSELGRAIVQPDTEPAARVEAFLRVPLYAAIFEKYRGHLLPPTKALEREMQALGVSSKQVAKARQIFERSAREAGFFASGEDRLVKPRLDLPTKPAGILHEEGGDRGNDDQADKLRGGGGGSSNDLHPFIKGLLDTLPEPETTWEANEQAKWLQTAASIFGLIYKSTGGAVITVTSANPSKTATDP